MSAEGEEFKSCPFCKHVWPTREAFLSDPTLHTVGYQAVLEDLVLGLFLFNHDNCGTTLAITASDFVDLYDGPIYEQRLTGSPDCQGYCLSGQGLDACPNSCECAWVREVLQIVKDWPRSPATPPRR
ncbi:MAG: hypothetical protein ABI333_14045 [bacterium]